MRSRMWFGSGRAVAGGVEQPEALLLAQHAPDRLVDAMLGDQTAVDRLQHGGRVILTAELVHSGVEEPCDSLHGIGVQHPPRSHRELDPESGEAHAVDDVEVGDDDAVEAELLAEEVCDDAALECEADLVVVQPERGGVAGHDPDDARLDRGDEGAQVFVEASTGVDGVCSPFEMGVLAVALWSATGEVLDRRGHARLAEAPHILAHEDRREVGVFAEGPGDARPAGLRGEIGHRMQGDVDARRSELFADHPCRLAYE